ncbi:hypothetical protein ACH4D4_24870 [Streptomyces pristinaespiralis]|uniref:hypothetical protein n=1 Tax=Streptomyces pristinaespiralis TaxID=38300 RepID=UPI00378B8A0F
MVMVRPEEPAVSGERGDSGVRALRAAVPALLAYSVIRILCLAVLYLWSWFTGRDATDLLARRWDSLWYVRVIEEGYGFTLQAPDGRVLSNMAFFPLLPWLESLVSAVTSLSPAHAGLFISAVASLVAAYGIFTVTEQLYGPRSGFFAVVLWAVLPVGIVQSMAYSESLFVALAVWSLRWSMNGDWMRAGVLASLAGLTRPVGLAVTAAVWAAALVQIWATSDNRDGVRPTGRMVLGLCVAPLGALGYILWVGHRTGTPWGYLDVQAEWGNGFDGGLAFSKFIAGLLLGPSFLAGLALLAGVFAIGWLYRRTIVEKQPVALTVYCGVVVILAICASGYFGSKPRLLIPAFPLLLPLANMLSRAAGAKAVGIAGTAALVAAVYGAFWLHGSGPP